MNRNKINQKHYVSYYHALIAINRIKYTILCFWLFYYINISYVSIDDNISVYWEMYDVKRVIMWHI